MREAISRVIYETRVGRKDHSSLRRLRVMNSESSLNSRYHGVAVEFFIGISDSDSAISRKRCIARTRYILHSAARARLREFLVNLRSPFIEIYSPKHSARRWRSVWFAYQGGIFAGLAISPFLPIPVYIEAISYVCARFANSQTTNEICSLNRFSSISVVFQRAIRLSRLIATYRRECPEFVATVSQSREDTVNSALRYLATMIQRNRDTLPP